MRIAVTQTWPCNELVTRFLSYTNFLHIKNHFASYARIANRLSQENSELVIILDLRDYLDYPMAECYKTQLYKHSLEIEGIISMYPEKSTVVVLPAYMDDTNDTSDSIWRSCLEIANNYIISKNLEQNVFMYVPAESPNIEAYMYSLFQNFNESGYYEWLGFQNG